MTWSAARAQPARPTPTARGAPLRPAPVSLSLTLSLCLSVLRSLCLYVCVILLFPYDPRYPLLDAANSVDYAGESLRNTNR